MPGCMGEQVAVSAADSPVRDGLEIGRHRKKIVMERRVNIPVNPVALIVETATAIHR